LPCCCFGARHRLRRDHDRLQRLARRLNLHWRPALSRTGRSALPRQPLSHVLFTMATITSILPNSTLTTPGPTYSGGAASTPRHRPGPDARRQPPCRSRVQARCALWRERDTLCVLRSVLQPRFRLGQCRRARLLVNLERPWNPRGRADRRPSPDLPETRAGRPAP
jgi:hypothetical protein